MPDSLDRLLYFLRVSPNQFAEKHRLDAGTKVAGLQKNGLDDLCKNLDDAYKVGFAINNL